MKRTLEKIMQADRKTRERLLDHLESMITEPRRARFSEVLAERTRHLTIVLEDIFQPHNASAVLRTCDCFGIQDVHIIENRNRYEVNPDVALGSSKWLSLYKYNRQEHNTLRCFQELRSKGYRIIAATPHEHDLTPDTLDISRKFALVFGTELEGLTEEALAAADGYVRIPMVGFTESLNISVSAAILLHTLSNRIRNTVQGWQLTPDESRDIRLEWAMSSLKHSGVIASEFLAKQEQ